MKSWGKHKKVFKKKQANSACLGKQVPYRRKYRNGNWWIQMLCIEKKGSTRYHLIPKYRSYKYSWIRINTSQTGLPFFYLSSDDSLGSLWRTALVILIFSFGSHSPVASQSYVTSGACSANVTSGSSSSHITIVTRVRHLACLPLSSLRDFIVWGQQILSLCAKIRKLCP